MNKIIWILWDSGYDKSPPICKACVRSWKQKNVGWKIIFLDYQNITKYIPVTEFNKILQFNSKTTQSDLIRLYLVGRFGGLYTDITNYCNIPLDVWLRESILVDGYWLHFDYDSTLPTFNFIYVNNNKHIFYNIYKTIIDDKELHDGEFLRIIKRFHSLMPSNMNKLKNNQIGKSSNNTTPKQGTKIIANDFRLMNEPHDSTFDSALKVYPFFKLTYKKVPGGELNNVFNSDSKVLKLISRKHE